MTANPLALESRRAPATAPPEDIRHDEFSTATHTEQRIWVAFLCRLIVAGLLLWGAGWVIGTLLGDVQ
jgi:hypothetical protein